MGTQDSTDEFEHVNFEGNSGIDTLYIKANIMLECMPEDLVESKSTLVQVMTWCRQQQAITWTTGDQDFPRHMAPLYRNDFILNQTLMMPQRPLRVKEMQCGFILIIMLT